MLRDGVDQQHGCGELEKLVMVKEMKLKGGDRALICVIQFNTDHVKFYEVDMRREILRTPPSCASCMAGYKLEPTDP